MFQTLSLSTVWFLHCGHSIRTSWLIWLDIYNFAFLLVSRIFHLHRNLSAVPLWESFRFPTLFCMHGHDEISVSQTCQYNS